MYTSTFFRRWMYILIWKEINKTLSEASTVAASEKKMERPCAGPTLYLEINGNDDELLKNMRFNVN